MRAAKAWVAAIGTLVTLLTAVLADNLVSIDEMGAIASALVVAVATVVAVYQVPNKEA